MILNLTIDLKKSERLAEIISIILGDGNLSKNGNTLTITLNLIKEPEYVEYVNNFSKSIFLKKPRFQNLPNNEAVQLRIHSRALIRKLISLGLKKGDKVKNQVGVPYWIKNNIKFAKACLKGLIDTDGSIFPVRRENSIKLNFKNNSRPLVADFKKMCEILDIRVSKIIRGITNSFRGKKFEYFKIHIGAKDQVAKFLYLVKPMKWKFKYQKIDFFLKENGSSIEKAFKYKLEDDLRYYPKLLINELKKK